MVNNVNFVATATGGLVQGNTSDKKEIILKVPVTEQNPKGFAQASPNFEEIKAIKVEASEEDKKSSLEENIVAETDI